MKRVFVSRMSSEGTDFVGRIRRNSSLEFNHFPRDRISTDTGPDNPLKRFQRHEKNSQRLRNGYRVPDNRFNGPHCRIRLFQSLGKIRTGPKNSTTVAPPGHGTRNDECCLDPFTLTRGECTNKNCRDTWKMIYSIRDTVFILA